MSPRFRWQITVEHDGDQDITFRTARTELPSGLVIERVDTVEPGGDPATVLLMTDRAGTELTITVEQCTQEQLTAHDVAGLRPYRVLRPPIRVPTSVRDCR